MIIITNAPVLPEKLAIYKSAFDILPRLVFGSFVAYIISQSWDIFIYHFIKKRNKSLFVRNNISTVTSQLFDTTIFILIAFAGREPFTTKESIAMFILTTWIFKIIVALIDYPFIHMSVKLYKKKNNG